MIQDGSKLIVLGLDGAIPYVIEDALAAGRLPNFHRLVDRGTFAVALPHPSGVTPGNWAHVSCGALPWTTGISEFALHRIGENFDDWVNAFGRQECRAETLWETLARRGLRSTTISYPHGRPRAGELHSVIGSDGMPSEDPGLTVARRSRGLFTANLAPADTYGWKEHEPLALDARGRGRLAVAPRGKDAGIWLEIGVELVAGNRARFTRLDTNVPVGELAAGQWSDWIAVASPERVLCEFRIRPLAIDTSANACGLYVGALQFKETFADPPELSRELRCLLGPYTEPLSISAFEAGWLDAAGLLDEFRLQARWQAQAAVELTRRRGRSAVLSKWHAFDKFYHQCFQKIQPGSITFQADRHEYFEGVHRGVLEIADEMVGIVLDGIDDRTTLVVCSDHGQMPSRRWANVNKFLQRTGYLVTREQDGKTQIDWSRTKAVCHPYSLVWINTTGRDPQGIVEPGEEWRALRDEIITALREWKDPATGRYVMAQVFAVEDGAFYGLGSPADGDIRFFCQPGYSIFRNRGVGPAAEELRDVTGPYLGDHGSCAPTARLGRGSEAGVAIFCGPGIARGYRRRRPLRMSDLLPTVLTGMSWPLPADSEGGVAMDCLR